MWGACQGLHKSGRVWLVGACRGLYKGKRVQAVQGPGVGLSDGDQYGADIWSTGRVDTHPPQSGVMTLAANEHHVFYVTLSAAGRLRCISWDSQR